MKISRESILRKALEMASHNLYCYSDNYLMTRPKPGKEEDFAECAAEVEILEAWLAEIAPTSEK
jgi:hypothetical protein